MKTNDNLESSISSSAISSVKYYAYSLIAEKEGYRQVARLFKALAKAETVQAVKGLQLAGELDVTSENLTKTVDSKTYDHTQRNPSYIEQADEDGNPAVASIFQSAAKTFKAHIRLLNEALDNLGRNKDFDYWVCTGCGYIDSGNEPASCRACGAAREKFDKVGVGF